MKAVEQYLHCSFFQLSALLVLLPQDPAVVQSPVPPLFVTCSVLPHCYLSDVSVEAGSTDHSLLTGLAVPAVKGTDGSSEGHLMDVSSGEGRNPIRAPVSGSKDARTKGKPSLASTTRAAALPLLLTHPKKHLLSKTRF